MIRFYIIFLVNGKVINIEPYEDKTRRDQSVAAAQRAAGMYGAEVQTLDID